MQIEVDELLDLFLDIIFAKEFLVLFENLQQEQTFKYRYCLHENGISFLDEP
jgi:hypothetical protein